MRIRSLMLGPFSVNCYLVSCEETKEGVVIDPGFDGHRICALIEQEKVVLKAIVNTHCHIDHVGAVDHVKRCTNAPYYIHSEEELVLKNIPQQAMMFGLPAIHLQKPDEYLEENDTIAFGKCSLRVLHTPGHSPGSISLAGHGVVFCGDVLFAGSIGRTDLPGGDFDTLISSIKTKLVPLGAQTRVMSGHGPETTIRDELRYNPFISGRE